MTWDEHLVSPAGLAAERSTPEPSRPPVLLDVRWKLGDRPGAGRARYAMGHLPGARFLDLESVLTGRAGDPRDGRHPLPDAATLNQGLGALGVEATHRVVVYDEAGSFAAERAWWVLRWAGLDARVLDGGIRGWVTTYGESGLVTGDDRTWIPTVLDLTVGQLPSLTTDEAARWPDHSLLLDARAPERYRGETEPLDPRAGHIPGAHNLAAARLFTDAGTLPSQAELGAALEDATGGPVDATKLVAVYCGSGVSATRTLLALAVLDHPATLYGGSWSAWSNDPSRPVATGDAP